MRSALSEFTVRRRRLRAYGVTSVQRQPSFANLPAIGEVVPEFPISTAWFGVLGPAKLPPAIADKLNSVIAGALKGSKLREQLESEGASPVGSSLADFAAFVRDDVKRWAPIVKASGATAD